MDYTMSTAKDMICRTGGSVRGTTIHHKRPGIKVLGAIDYLVNYCKHNWTHQEDTKKESVSGA